MGYIDESHPLRERVAEEIRSVLGRKQMNASQLARELKVSQTYIWRRLAGETAFDTDDLERIAVLLRVPVADLLPPDVRTARQPTVAKVSVAERLKDGRPKGREGARPKGRGDRHGPKSAVEQEIRRPTWRTNPGDVSQQRNAA